MSDRRRGHIRDLKPSVSRRHPQTHGNMADVGTWSRLAALFAGFSPGVATGNETQLSAMARVIVARLRLRSRSDARNVTGTPQT